MSLELILSWIAMINWHTIAFYIIAGLMLLSSLYVVLTGHVVRSALSLIFTFLMVAALFFLLEAEYLAIIQILIYAGAISVLIVFSVMLITNRSDNIFKSSPFSKNIMPGAIAALFFFSIVLMVIKEAPWRLYNLEEKSFNDVSLIAQGFLNEHLIAFELAALLLLVALAAAIFIVKEAKDDNN